MRHRLLVAAVLTAAAGLLGACGAAGRALSQRDLVVVFVSDRSQADVDRVRAACDGAGGARALPPGPDNAANRRYPLRFDVTGLDLPARSKLTACLSADRSVRGYLDSESTSGL